jgi:anaerobic selenocysteine-containing dehydrogenase
MSDRSRVRGVCPHDCPDTCGFVTTVQNGKAIEFRGDPDHPFTKGFLCQKVSKYLERTYHRDRVLYPMRRTGKKGQAVFERVSWDDAIAEIATKLRICIASSAGPESILPYSYAGTLGKIQAGSLDYRFFHRIGASLLDRTICATAGAAGCDVTLGTRAVIDPESLLHSRMIVNWGSNTAVTNSHLWAIMHQARKRGARIITIDPSKNQTARKSDQWIGLRPGTDGAFALGMMHILFRNGWVDQDYLDRYCLGTEQLKKRVLEYTPEKVSQITSVPIEVLEAFTDEYAHANEKFGGPSLLRINYGLQRHGGGGMAVRTICCLPAITGAWRHIGGGALLSTSKLFPWNNADLQRPDLIPHGTKTINMVQLPEALLGELPGQQVNCLIVYGANPASSNPDQQRVIQGLQREDLFTVVHEHFMTDTAKYADIVLPATTQLEHYDVHSGYGHMYVQLNAPAIDPIGESKPNTEFFRLLARAMNFESELFEVGDLELVKLAIQPKAGTNGYPSASAFSEVTIEKLLEGAPIRLNVPKDYAPFAKGGFGTPSGKCEFYSESMKQRGMDPLPTYIPPHEDPQTQPELAAKYPLQMITPPEAGFLNSLFANLESIRNDYPEPKLEIHPRDAVPRNLHSGAWVEVKNDRGSFQARAVVTEEIQPGVVASYGLRWSEHSPDGKNCNSISSTKLTDLGGGATFFDNLVEVCHLNPKS